jgi:hypothetical protein
MIIVGKLLAGGVTIADHVEFSVNIHPHSNGSEVLWDGVFRRPKVFKISTADRPLAIMIEDGRASEIAINRALNGDSDEMIRFLGHGIPPWDL